jgi:hypothetical protein
MLKPDSRRVRNIGKPDGAGWGSEIARTSYAGNNEDPRRRKDQ